MVGRLPIWNIPGEAEHIIESEMKQGRSREEAERIAYATMNKRRKSK
jgi:hypothetical protein